MNFKHDSDERVADSTTGWGPVRHQCFSITDADVHLSWGNKLFRKYCLLEFQPGQRHFWLDGYLRRAAEGVDIDNHDPGHSSEHNDKHHIKVPRSAADQNVRLYEKLVIFSDWGCTCARTEDTIAIRPGRVRGVDDARG